MLLVEGFVLEGIFHNVKSISKCTKIYNRVKSRTITTATALSLSASGLLTEVPEGIHQPGFYKIDQVITWVVFLSPSRRD